MTMEPRVWILFLTFVISKIGELEELQGVQVEEVVVVVAEEQMMEQEAQRM